ncbi:2,3,4,5-tetrahydropyridine-2,6-dicarboxylate N-succinyltransferase [Amnibacterium kyonggiense]|uniref:2,3,4,5-tetrahydropyridine-2,6-dicarboxylate N-succinyltransferase n=1 Tax=Amnibacterium kyonggiense TaxID=595671 RepID=A0A4R7FH08_9MICO|nr:2,3,4,5-tetrahydropyridine-2,6-dicarboxylate N-succinyltransferase [Amnibacterium kyonggiense]TDS75987.1 2,3,4,5-tetrahydropyridine-2-carboxylate N-succinyltransferase [Amnibacterium kyonggiense]
MSDPQRTGWGHGLATRTKDGTVLDVWFPSPALGAAPEADPPRALEAEEHIDELRRVRIEAVTVEAALDEPVVSTADAYLRLHLLSHLVVAPNTVSLEGLMAHLPISAWTPRGPMLPVDAQRRLPALRRAGLEVIGLDRFPRLTDYVLPDRVRIADAGRVRLGAHLAPGTVVMHAGFVNFNAGTLGTSMVEGRISQGVVVGDGSDVGGGASIMGTLSGGGTQRVSIGRRSLLGANSGLGIAIGDDCVVEAGLYVTAGTKLTLRVPGQEPRTVKAVELSGQDAWLFRRNSVTGEVEAVPRTGPGIALNPTLHA